MKIEIRKIAVSPEVTEVQVWYRSKLVGAGAFTNPIRDVGECIKKIVGVWLCGC